MRGRTSFRGIAGTGHGSLPSHVWRESRDRLDEHFLRDFLGILRIEDHPHVCVASRCLMSQYQVFQMLRSDTLLQHQSDLLNR